MCRRSGHRFAAKNMRHSTIARSKKPGASAGLECSKM
jgi:hypothetical protein